MRKRGVLHSQHDDNVSHAVLLRWICIKRTRCSTERGTQQYENMQHVLVYIMHAYILFYMLDVTKQCCHTQFNKNFYT